MKIFKNQKSSFIVILCFSVIVFSDLSRASNSLKYGCPWNADSLFNISLDNYKCSFRFQAEITGNFKSIQFYNKKNNCDKGYCAGDGGRVKITLQTDDNSDQHRPSGTVLAENIIEDPLNEAYFPVIELRNSQDQFVQLIKDNLYHIVFENIHNDPLNNYISINCLAMKYPVDPYQPGISNINLGVLGNNNVGWKDMKEFWGWSFTPVFEIKYENGYNQGQGYEATYLFYPRKIYGANRVREIFTLSRDDMVVSQVSFRIAKKGIPGDLTIRLESSAGDSVDGELIYQGVIPQDSIPIAAEASFGGNTRLLGKWITCTFNKYYILENSKRYSIVLSTTRGDGLDNYYEVFPLQHGNFRTSNVFLDGYAQYTAGSGWQGWSREDGVPRKDGDLQFYFTSEAVPTVTVVSPNGGENLYQGSTHQIEWTTIGPIANVKIMYSTNGVPGPFTTIINSTPNDGSYIWTIPNNITQNGCIRISDTVTDVYDKNDASFSIISPKVSVVSPNGGEILYRGSTHQIEWTTIGPIANVKIMYSTNGVPGPFTTIINSTPNDGSYTWIIPNNITQNGCIRISDTVTDVYDKNDASFSIISPKVTVVSPNGGESLSVGSPHQVKWTTIGPIANVKIMYSTNGVPGPFTTIIDSTPNDGSYIWTIPNNITQNGCIRISDTVTDVYDKNDAPFSIVPLMPSLFGESGAYFLFRSFL